MIEACHLNQSMKNYDGVDDRHQDINNISDDDSNRCSNGDISKLLSQHKIPLSSFEAIRSAIETIMHQNINQSDNQNNYNECNHSQDEEKGENNEVKYSIKHLSPLVSQLKLLIS